MSTYVMSDIHGCFDMLMRMLDYIEFSDTDTLIIAGDYIDRGLQNKQMLEWIVNVPDNVKLIKGNHDLDFADKVYTVLEKTESERDEQLRVYAKYLCCNEVSYNELKQYADTIASMPYIHRLTINEQKCIIVHAGYITSDKLNTSKYSSVYDFYLHAREDSYTDGGARDSIIISGHTPTISRKYGMYNHGKIYETYNKSINCRFYDIDCGCSYINADSDARLACLRLDDMKIYYIQ